MLPGPPASRPAHSLPALHSCRPARSVPADFFCLTSCPTIAGSCLEIKWRMCRLRMSSRRSLPQSSGISPCSRGRASGLPTQALLPCECDNLWILLCGAVLRRSAHTLTNTLTAHWVGRGTSLLADMYTVTCGYREEIRDAIAKNIATFCKTWEVQILVLTSFTFLLCSKLSDRCFFHRLERPRI